MARKGLDARQTVRQPFLDPLDIHNNSRKSQFVVLYFSVGAPHHADTVPFDCNVAVLMFNYGFLFSL